MRTKPRLGKSTGSGTASVEDRDVHTKDKICQEYFYLCVFPHLILSAGMPKKKETEWR